MRREQYTLRDSYKKIMFTQDDDAYSEPIAADFDVDIEVMPLGLKHNDILSGVIFRKWSDLNPENTPKEFLQDISNLYWKKQQFAPSA